MAAESQALQFEFRLSEMLAPDVVPRTDLEAIHPLAYFGLVRQVMTVLSGGERSQGLRDEVARSWGGDPAPYAAKQIETASAADRHRLSGLTARAMRGWPWLFGPLRRRPGLEVLGVCGPALWPITVRLCRSSDPLPDALTAVACSSLGVGCVAAAPR
ncbi:hypothetical protein [Pseudomonas asiatica]|uniref:hypothetical protein n=1 Tax=Pseudomonas asiatica TaxID=2219225 RepID=UPI002015FCC7|nr:hypothetical protein [Pseudomonas asiatica]